MATVREFNGERFYLKKTGHYRNPNGGLHRRVWESYNGPIPDGMIVHHIDHDPGNNEIENLMLMSPSEHHSYHANHPEMLPKLAGNVVRARAIGNIIDVPGNCGNCKAPMFGARKSVGEKNPRRKQYCSKKCCAAADWKRRRQKGK